MTTPPKMIVVEMGEDYDEKLKQYDLTNTRVVPMPNTGTQVFIDKEHFLACQALNPPSKTWMQELDENPPVTTWKTGTFHVMRHPCDSDSD